MTPGYVSISRFRVRNGMEGDVASAFRERPHRVDDAPGFLRMDVLSPSEDASEFWLVTYWSDEASFRTWHHGHEFRRRRRFTRLRETDHGGFHWRDLARRDPTKARGSVADRPPCLDPNADEPSR